ncbi:GNAT family protein [Nibribacter koreensis]|uniref:GNAT family protein n=1 Tax=Nibribacter koreensis TaxID=1084519 RepID=UPI0031E6B7CB
MQTVTAQCAADNRGSYRILEKLGFERVSQPQGMICWTLSSKTLTCAQQASRFQPVF